MKRVVPIAIALCLVAALAYAFWPQPLPVDLAPVVRGPLEVTVDEEGKTRIKDRYVVSAPLAGRLRRIELREGDPIEAGKTLIAMIEPGDPTLLDARSLAEAEARVRAAEASLLQAGPNLERAKAALEYAQSENRRFRQLAEKNVATKTEIENSELLVRTRAEELKSAEYAIQISQFELDLARAALTYSKPNGELSAEREGVAIHSPVDGRVLHVYQKSATVVTPSTELVEVGDPANLEVEIDVLSQDAVVIGPGTQVRLEQWGGSAPLRGHVRLVEPAAFTKVSALGVEEQRVNVIVDFDDPPAQRSALGDGYRVEARILTWHSPDVLKVPSSALFRTEQNWTVYRIVDGKATLTPVEIGHNNALEAEVVNGLSEGDFVIPHPSDKLTDGQRVVKR